MYSKRFPLTGTRTATKQTSWIETERQMKRGIQKTIVVVGGISAAVAGHASSGSAQTTPVCGDPQRINFADAQMTGGSVEWIVPAEATEVLVRAAGGRGGNATASTRARYSSVDSPNSGLGGRGAVVESQFAVTPGEALTVFVGGGGDGVNGGFNGGGSGRGDTTQWSGGGGGATDVRQGGFASSNRIVVAGGGGGVGAADWYNLLSEGYMLIPVASPNHYGAGGDAGLDGGVSSGFALDGTTATPGAGSWNDRFATTYAATATAGAAGQAAAGGAGGTASNSPLYYFWSSSSGNAGLATGVGGNGVGKSLGDDYSGRAASGGGGGGYYGGGSGGAVGFGNSSTPVEMLAGGGGGGSSLGTVVGFNALVDGYVDIAACAVPAVAPTTTATTIAATTTTNDALIDAPVSVASTTTPASAAPIEPVAPTQPRPAPGGGALPETGGTHNRELGTAGLFGGLGALMIALSHRGRRSSEV
jgi:hypothetical protein